MVVEILTREVERDLENSLKTEIFWIVYSYLKNKHVDFCKNTDKKTKNEKNKNNNE